MNMKTKLLTLLLLLLSVAVFAQNDLKARIEYEDAETAFANKEYEIVLSQLEKAKQILGKENSKILYLQILTERRLADRDTSYFSKVTTTIKRFEKLPDYKMFPEEKRAEIYRLYSKLESEKNTVIDKINDTKALEDNFKKYSYQDWPIGIPLDELKLLKKDSFFFRHKTKAVKKPNEYFGFQVVQLHTWDTGMMVSEGLQSVYLDGSNLVKGYKTTFKQGYYKGTLSQSTLDQIIEPIVNELSSLFGFSPKKSKQSSDTDKYEWSNGNKSVIITFGGYQNQSDQFGVMGQMSILTR